jgi:transcriptional regulator GlxA family with amidase domain
MQQRLAEPMLIGDLAASVNLSPSRFRELFTRQVGLGPAQYLQRLRLRRARLLIERTFLTVKEVMALVGYNDPSHFSRDFRRLHGVAPSALRGAGVTTPLPRQPGSSVDRPTHRRIRQAIAGVPGTRCA